MSDFNKDKKILGANRFYSDDYSKKNIKKEKQNIRAQRKKYLRDFTKNQLDDFEQEKFEKF